MSAERLDAGTLGWIAAVELAARAKGLDLGKHAAGLGAGLMFVARARAKGMRGGELEETVARLAAHWGLSLEELLASGPGAVA